MASRKTQQEIDKTFKKVSEGIQTFEGIYEKIRQATNPTQRDKLEDNLKREIKKLQRFRDQIKSWAAGNEVKDKAPLIEQRKAIEVCMEQFKAVEKEMKTKAYSKEGLSAASRLDPKEKERVECSEFLSSMVDELQLKIEALEAEEETLHAQMKKGKKDTKKADRMADVAHVTERHKWHVNKLEFLNRSLQNGNLEVGAVQDLKESIKYYVEEGGNLDYSGEDETLYDDLNIEDVEAQFGMGGDGDRVQARDPSTATTVHANEVPFACPCYSSPVRFIKCHPGHEARSAPHPTPGETLKYASAAAAAAASDKSGVGILPLPPPPGLSPALSVAMPISKPSSTASPIVAPAQPVAKSIMTPSTASEELSGIRSKTPAGAAASSASSPTPADKTATTNGKAETEGTETEESVYHLPPGLQDLVQSFDVTKARATANPSPSVQRLLAASLTTCPEAGDAEKPRHYKPQNPYSTPYTTHRNPSPYSMIPGCTYQQYLAAKALRNQSWRFHKQYQTWFQRHEEPKNITEEFEQGTYRFFDYESTWMNRRKADFKFVYKYLEDEL
ncbi:hypothetical protein N7522_004182 [Penicillium canescens]|nr:hypothetical protein N7522_004182 [Penicillium canescens]